MNGVRRQVPILVAFAVLTIGCDAPGIAEVTGAEARFEASTNAPTQMVSGGGTVDVTSGRSVYTFHAMVDGAGAASGSFQLHFTSVDARVRGNVTCALVVGNYARLVGVVTASSDESLVAVGTVYHWQAIDNGEGSDAAPDLVTAYYPVVNSPSLCNYVDLPDNAWTNGNVQIR